MDIKGIVCVRVWAVLIWPMVVRVAVTCEHGPGFCTVNIVED
jgi:hypothetical protein